MLGYIIEFQLLVVPIWKRRTSDDEEEEDER
jgi:hypothetical protein